MRIEVLRGVPAEVSVQIAVLLIFTGSACRKRVCLNDANREAMEALREIYWNCVAKEVEQVGVVSKKNGHDHTAPKRFRPGT